VLFVTNDHTVKNYGVTTVVSQLANEIANRDNDIQVVIAAIGRTSVQQSESVTIELLPSARIGMVWNWSPNLIGRLDDIVTRYHIDLIHVHGVWAAVQWAALMIARYRKIPSIVSSHAMLEPWYWNKQGLLKKIKKKLYFHLVFQRAITESTIFHAITPIEKDNIHKLLPKQKIVVIPNVIGLDKENIYENSRAIMCPEQMFLFLGRLHPVKGVDLLVNAFYQANLGSKWRLVLAGPESVPLYAKKIKMTVSNLGLSNRVEFVGPVFGAAKLELVRKAWAVVFPSYCEVVGMVNLEAAACMVPSITTFETGLWDWEEGGGMLIHPDVNELANSLLRMTRWSLAERLHSGDKSLNLVANNYSWKAVVPKWEALYLTLITNHDLQSN